MSQFKDVIFYLTSEFGYKGDFETLNKMLQDLYNCMDDLRADVLFFDIYGKGAAKLPLFYDFLIDFIKYRIYEKTPAEINQFYADKLHFVELAIQQFDTKNSPLKQGEAEYLALKSFAKYLEQHIKKLTLDDAQKNYLGYAIVQLSHYYNIEAKTLIEAIETASTVKDLLNSYYVEKSKSLTLSNTKSVRYKISDDKKAREEYLRVENLVNDYLIENHIVTPR